MQLQDLKQQQQQQNQPGMSFAFTNWTLAVV